MGATPDENLSVIGVAQLARIFHDAAGPYLCEQGFDLANDPRGARSPYQATVATYRSKRGLYLSVGFEPLDGRYAEIAVGRRWRLARPGRHRGQDVYRLSNLYSVLAGRFGLTVPTSYELHPGDAFLEDVARILCDLKRTLPTIIARTTRDDLIHIEAERFGARGWLKDLGPDDASAVVVDPFEDGC